MGMIKPLLLLSFISCSALTKASLLPAMPQAVSNNAVTQVKINNQDYLLSFSGLSRNKTYKDVHNKAYLYDVKKAQWQTIAPVPLSKHNLQLTNGLTGRLASVATAIDDKAYIFGGYTVAKNGNEVSIEDVYSYDLTKDRYKRLKPMPISVDDSVALPYQNKFIYLISGWHNSGNVNLVQVFNTQTNSWQQATPFPGKAVFGHAGGIVDNKMLICDGVAIKVHKNKRRTYQSEAACYLGIINPKQPAKIDWQIIEHPTHKARYRMAALGLSKQQQIVFIGGSENPYNYDGIGYNGKPAQPSNKIWTYDLSTQKWQIKIAATATMDHRGLLTLDNKLITLGGMGKNQQVLDSMVQY